MWHHGMGGRGGAYSQRGRRPLQRYVPSTAPSSSRSRTPHLLADDLRVYLQCEKNAVEFAVGKRGATLKRTMCAAVKVDPFPDEFLVSELRGELLAKSI